MSRLSNIDSLGSTAYILWTFIFSSIGLGFSIYGQEIKTWTRIYLWFNPYDLSLFCF